MELKEGMYVRYKYENIVFIGKTMFISEVMCGLDETLQIDIDNCIEEILKKDILKASNNIIDLIEVGDYVNEFYVEDVKETFVNVATGSNYFQSPTIYEEDIKLIVTKEQFESMSYKVKENEK